MILSGKRVAITGAFGALGTAVVARVLAEGGRVAALDHAPGPRSPATFGNSVLIGGIDLADGAAANAALLRAADGLGGLDALVNIAGGFAWEKLDGGNL